MPDDFKIDFLRGRAWLGNFLVVAGKISKDMTCAGTERM